jgi:hypothetical protein
MSAVVRDETISARPHLIALAAIVVAGLLAAAVLHDAVVLDLAFTLLLYAVLGQSWNWISGYAGNISFGHAIFFGCGAYASALLRDARSLAVAGDPGRSAGRGSCPRAGDRLSLRSRCAATTFRSRRSRSPRWSTRSCAHSPGSDGANGFELPIAVWLGRVAVCRTRGHTSLLALALFTPSCSWRRSRSSARGLDTICVRCARTTRRLLSVGIDERRWKLIAFAWSADDGRRLRRGAVRAVHAVRRSAVDDRARDLDRHRADRRRRRDRDVVGTGRRRARLRRARQRRCAAASAGPAKATIW